jgi:sterol 24-C-methyltransferase
MPTVSIAIRMSSTVCSILASVFHMLNVIWLLLGYYDGATELYEWGWAQSFHFSRFYKGESFAASLARHEHYLAFKMGLKPGMRVLDVGCGVGGPAREIAQFSDVQIVGLNNNEFQVGRARKYTKKMGLENQVTFVKGDFMKLAEQFGENSFDAGTWVLSSFQLHQLMSL